MEKSFDAWQQLATEQVRQQHAKEQQQQGNCLWQPQRRDLPTTSPATTNCERRHIRFWFDHPAFSGSFNSEGTPCTNEYNEAKYKINEQGQIIPKDRLNHNQSYAWGSGTSINSRVCIEDLLPCHFGACIQRLINYTVTTHKKYPISRILATKTNYKSAHHCCHLNWLIAVQTITQL
jgi:hypothetical protein